MKPLVDFHCHLDLFSDFEETILECEREMIYTLAVTTTPRAWPRNFELTKEKKFVRAALGLHPQLVGDLPNELETWESHFFQAKYIGEVGLDASPKFYKFYNDQIKVFDHISSRCALSGGKVLSIHSVRSIDKVLDVIEKHRTNQNNKVVLHWFTGTRKQAERAVKLNCYFSVNLPMLQKSTSLLNYVPISRLLTETDGPFAKLSGSPMRPKDVVQCLPYISSALKMTAESTRDLIAENLKQLLTDQY